MNILVLNRSWFPIPIHYDSCMAQVIQSIQHHQNFGNESLKFSLDKPIMIYANSTILSLSSTKLNTSIYFSIVTIMGETGFELWFSRSNNAIKQQGSWQKLNTLIYTKHNITWTIQNLHATRHDTNHSDMQPNNFNGLLH